MAKTKKTEERITFDNILGYAQEKESINKIVTLLKDYDKYSSQGISIPRGLIFQGPPGTGKTLFAKAIAGECSYKFFTAFKEEVEEEDALKTLKKVFKEAEDYSTKNNSPSLIYIDELDKIAYVNSNDELYDKDARDATRFLLQKLDETTKTNRILIIASTNNYYRIPPALLRSGRFDRKILIDVPDLESRKEIIKYYINNHKLFKNINITKLALKTKGMSGADIKTLINNTLIEYVTTKTEIEEDDFIKVINEMHFETIGKKWNNPNKLLEVLVHEVGHSVVSGVLTGNYGEINAIKYGEVGGATVFDDCEDEYAQYERVSRDAQDVVDKICVSLGGMVSEKIFLHKDSIGGSSDIETISSCIRFLCDNAYYGFYYCSMLHRGGEYMQTKRHHKYVEVANKLYKKTYKILKRNMSLVLYLIHEVHLSNDVLSQTNVAAKVEYFNKHKKELQHKYKLSMLKNILTID